MKKLLLLACGALSLLGLSGNLAQAGRWGVGVYVGPGYYGPYYGGYYAPYYYAPYPVYAAPPVVVQQAPVVQQVPVAQPANPAPAPVVARSQGADTWQADVDRNLQQLADANDQVRADSVMQLGRLKAQVAVDPLTATLAGDRSPQVREAAARALGLIGSAKAVPALQHAAQADNDRDVRHSAEFALDVLQSNRN